MKSKGIFINNFRSLHDSICVAKRTLESGKIVAGGGAVDVALSIYLDQYCRNFSGKEQIAIAEFSEALNVIPKTLSVNAAKDATELISKLRTLHTASQKEGETDEKKISLKYCGLDLLNGKPRNNLRAGVLEPMLSKINSIRFATEAAITILRIDDMIKLAPEQREERPHH
jgi:T-complex protein 1 subunit alpha